MIASRTSWYRYIRDILAEVASKFETVRPVKYSEILLLDQKIRDFRSEEPFYLVARNHDKGKDGVDTMNLLARFHLSMHKDISMCPLFLIK